MDKVGLRRKTGHEIAAVGQLNFIFKAHGVFGSASGCTADDCIFVQVGTNKTSNTAVLEYSVHNISTGHEFNGFGQIPMSAIWVRRQRCPENGTNGRCGHILTPPAELVLDSEKGGSGGTGSWLCMLVLVFCHDTETSPPGAGSQGGTPVQNTFE